MGRSSRAKRKARKVRIDESSSEHLIRPDNRGFLEKKVVHVFFITIIALLAYSNTFHSPFQFDDVAQIVKNPFIRDLDNFISDTEGHNYNHPRILGYLTFALNYHVGGLSVTGYHIANLAIHIANALLVYFLVLMTFRTPAMRQSTDSSPYTSAFIALFQRFFSFPIRYRPRR
jgi:protein O-mannosyl-transferase